MQDPNSLDQELKDGQNLNPSNDNLGTEGENTLENPTGEAEQPIDYQKKFSESSSEALRLLAETKRLEQEKAELELRLSEKGNDPVVDIPSDKIPENFYPGFEELDPEAQDNLVKFADTVTRRAQEQILKDPAIAFAKGQYNETKWEQAFGKVAEKYPELKESKDEFKAKYFKPSNVPANIENILEDVSKIYLFDKAKDIGAREEKQKASRIDMERATGGDKTPKSSRSLEDWQRMAAENPALFAKNSKQYQEDLDSGKI